MISVWTNGTDTVVAADLTSVRRIVETHYGTTLESEGWSLSDWTEVLTAKPITIRNVSGNGHDDVLTLTAAEWAERDGAGFLCSTEW